jgi:hypothetical protein
MPSDPDSWFDSSDEPTDDLTGAIEARATASRPTRRERTFAPGRGARVGKLAVVVAGAVLIAVAGASLLGGSSRAALDRAYVESMTGPASASAAVGRSLERDLSGGRSLEQVAGVVVDLARRQEAATNALASVIAPPRLRTEHQHALSAMIMRTQGLSALITGLRTKASASALALAGERLVTSDVLWQLTFRAPASAEFAREDVRGLTPPPSVFLSSGDVVAPEAFVRNLARWKAGGVRPAATVQVGDHGSAVVAWQQALMRWQRKTNRRVLPLVAGAFDGETQTATIEFQQAAGLAADGVVGPLTRAAMALALAAR